MIVVAPAGGCAERNTRRMPPVRATANATAAFANSAGGSGAYTYSYDFNNDGNFEITGSSTANATIPESYLDDGPSTRVVHGRITDGLGGYTDFTFSTTVTIRPTSVMSYVCHLSGVRGVSGVGVRKP